MILTVSTWIVSLAGFALAVFIGFANGMKSAPGRSPTDIAVACVLPAIAVVLAIFVLRRTWSAAGAWSALLQGGLPIFICVVAVVLAADLLPTRRGNIDLAERETATRADGTKYFRDCAKNWRIEESSCRFSVAREAEGAMPPGNAASWAEFWANHFAGLEKWQENPGRYIGLILQLRREAKLPELTTARSV